MTGTDVQVVEAERLPAVPQQTGLIREESLGAMERRLDRMKGQLELVQRFFKDVMVPSMDYGRIPGCQLPSLLKAGAEKMCELYGYAPSIKQEQSTKDRETGFCEYEHIVQLLNRATGETVAEGTGSANTMESRYRYRWFWENELPRDLPKDRLKCRERETKKGIFRQYQIENDDPWSLWNTVKKMSLKRALVDAVLRATRSSGIFTQDMEDIAEWADQAEGQAGDDGQEIQPGKKEVPQANRPVKATNPSKPPGPAKAPDDDRLRSLAQAEPPVAKKTEAPAQTQAQEQKQVQPQKAEQEVSQKKMSF